MMQAMKKRLESVEEVKAALEEVHHSAQLLEPVAQRKTAAEAAAVRTYLPLPLSSPYYIAIIGMGRETM